MPKQLQKKSAIGWYLDGRVTAVLGTHTHVPTADARILPGGTAFQTDVGMSGPYDSVIGVEVEQVLDRFYAACRRSLMPRKNKNPKDVRSVNRMRCDNGSSPIHPASHAGRVPHSNDCIG